MHYRTLLTPFLLTALHATAQIPPAVSHVSFLNAATIRLQKPSPSPPPSPPPTITGFSHFEVLDERVDTGRIGIHTCIPDFGRNHDRQLVFGHSAAAEIAGYLNQRFTQPQSPYTALVILRTLWLSDAAYPRAELRRNPERRLERTHIRLKAEIYAIRDGHYIPLLRFDTLQIALKKRILSERSPYYEWGQNLSLLMDNLADSARRLTQEKEDDNRWVDLADIRQFNDSRFYAPIGDTEPARGVYANFEEFRNNTPSIQDFEIKTENHERLLYIRESGTAYYSHEAWGYCDGKTIYIMRDGVLYPACKEGKAFYIPTGAATGGPLTISHDYKRRIFFIDMDTGDIY